MKNKILLFITVLMIVACGWQFRDSKVGSNNIGNIRLISEQPYDQLLTELSRALEAYGVDTADNGSAPDYSVVITDFRRIRRTSSMNADARVAEYQLNEEVDFMILDQSGEILLNPSTASVERVYEFLENDVLASSKEEWMVKRDMRLEIIRQIINRLQVLPRSSEN